MSRLSISIDSHSDRIKYKSKFYKVDVDKLFESIAYLKKILESLGFKVTRNSQGDLNIYKK